jgi:hypothetical protein
MPLLEIRRCRSLMPDREQFRQMIWDRLAANKLISFKQRSADSDPVEIPAAAWDTPPEWSGFKVRRDDVLAIWGRGPMPRTRGPLPNIPWPVARITLVRNNAEAAPAPKAKGSPTSARCVSEQELSEFLKTLGSCNADKAWPQAEKHFGTSIDRDLVRNNADRVGGKRGRPRGIS